MKKFNILLLVMVLAVALTGCIGQSKASSEAASSSSQGTAADAVLTRFDGQKTSIKELYKDKPLYINFWASWCGPCVNEMPNIDSLAQKYGDQINFAAISVDEEPGDAKAFVQRSGFSMSFYTGDNQLLGSAYGLSAIPVSILVDKDGNIIAKAVGGMSESDLEEFLQPALK